MRRLWAGRNDQGVGLGGWCNQHKEHKEMASCGIAEQDVSTENIEMPAAVGCVKA